MTTMATTTTIITTTATKRNTHTKEKRKERSKEKKHLKINATIEDVGLTEDLKGTETMSLNFHDKPKKSKSYIVLFFKSELPVSFWSDSPDIYA